MLLFIISENRKREKETAYLIKATRHVYFIIQVMDIKSGSSGDGVRVEKVSKAIVGDWAPCLSAHGSRG